MSTPPQEETQLRVYKRRWFIIAAAAAVNASNAMLWNSYAPVADLTHRYYHIDFVQVNLLSMVYMLITILVGVPAAWTIDTLGLKTALIFAGICNFLGAAMRLLTVFDFVGEDYKFYVLITGQCVCAIAQPFLMFAPPKIAQHWFAPNQRALANTLASMANPLGIAITGLLSPGIMKSAEDMVDLQIIYFSPAAASLLLVLVSVRSSRPPLPPSSSADDDSETFLAGLKLLVRNGPYLMLCCIGGGGIALFTCLTAMLEQMLCPRDYTDDFAGMAGAVMVFVGILGAGIFGIIVDKTGMFIEITKVCFAFATMSLCAFSAVMVLHYEPAYILITLICFGFFGMGMYPILLELAVECTYPVAEATSAGVLIIVGQILSLGLIIGMQLLAVEVVSTYTACSYADGFLPADFTDANYLLISLAALTTIIFLFFFRTEYKRVAAEKLSKMEKGIPVNGNSGEEVPSLATSQLTLIHF